MLKRKHHLTKSTIGSTIKKMAEEVKSIIARPNNTLLKIGLVVVILLIIIAAFFTLKAKPLQPVAPKIVHAPLDDLCQVKKEGNPLVMEATSGAYVASGVLRGEITSITKDPGRDAYIISLTSLDKKQTHQFSVNNIPDLVIDPFKNKAFPISSLKVDQIIKLKFNCNKEDNLFYFNLITLESSSSSQPKSGK